MTELEVIQNSEYFDAAYYYAQRPDVLAAGVDAAHHYLNWGWRENSNPSPKFTTQLYLAHHKCDRCPLLDYIEKGAVGDYSGRASSDDILRYRRCRRWRPRMFRTACYTYVSRGYDDLMSHAFINPKWDYICFTDDPDLIRRKTVGIWKIRRTLCTKYDSKNNTSWHKTHPEKCCRGYRNSVWIDANVSVLTPYLANEIQTRQSKILIPIHNHRDCVYDETDIVQKWNLDSLEKCSAVRHLLKSSGMPRHYGLNENNVIYRQHHDRTIRKIDAIWWKLIRQYSRRDQLSLSYILWRYGIRPTDIAINNTREDKVNFYVSKHIKATKSTTFLDNPMKYGFWGWVQMRILCSLIPVKKWRHNARRHIRRRLCIRPPKIDFYPPLTSENNDLPASLVSCDIYNYRQLIANGTRFQHLVGVVISRAAKIGKNCIIYQNVTIGSKDFATGDGKTRTAYPEIGNDVTIYAGAVIIGPVKIGDSAIIGANAVVVSDVPPHCIAVGVPAKIIKTSLPNGTPSGNGQ